MKDNKHYAARMSEPEMRPNGLKPDQVGKEGSDIFVRLYGLLPIDHQKDGIHLPCPGNETRRILV